VHLALLWPQRHTNESALVFVLLAPKRAEPHLSKAYCLWEQTCWVWATLQRRDEVPLHGEGVHTRQESGPPSKLRDGQEMRYNDSDHKETPGGQWGW
jgi:hypothetical protein